MDDYIASVQKTLTDLDHQINEATAGWKFCSTNVVSIKCRNALRNAPSLSATAANTLQKLCKENERLLQNNATNDSRRARCLTCIGSILKRILFGLLPNYWIQFGLSFGGIFVTRFPHKCVCVFSRILIFFSVNERPTTTIPETETSYTPTGSDQSTIATGSTMPGQAVPGSTTPAKETGGGSTPAPTPALTTTATSAPDGSTATNDASGRSDNGAPGPS